MKPRLVYIPIIFLLLLTACMAEDSSPLESSTFIITGNQQAAFEPTSSTPSGRASSSPLFEAGSQISFFSKGGIEAEGLTLTFDGNLWNGLASDTWIPGEKTASVAAYYPTLSTPIYQSDGALTDWLFLKEEFAQTNQISLRFSHLFSQISFHIQPGLNSQATDLCFTPSTSVSSIDPHTARVTLGTDPHPLHMQQRADATYTFIVPPAEATSINIEITCADGKTYTTQLPASSFKSGTHYQCNILYDDGAAGIRTAEDFIAFSYLINGKEYGGRKLSEFGTTVNGKTVYRLKNDIRFTDEEASKPYPIGYAYTYEGCFEDVFDGNHHTLSNIKIIRRKTIGDLGIFGTIGQSGEVKNLSIKGIIYDTVDKYDNYDGMLCGENQGIIDNCHADSCIIKSCNNEQEIAGLCGINFGTMINCSVKHLDATKAHHAAGLAYRLSGILANCYVTTCTPPKKGDMGYICNQMLDNGVVCNNYVYETKQVQKEVFAVTYMTYGTPQIKNIYYPSQMNPYDEIKSGMIDHVLAYSNQSADKIPGWLNDWITQEGASQYPQLKFTRWQKGEQLPAIFATPNRSK